MCLSCMKKWAKKNMNYKGFSNFFRPDRTNVSLFLLIASVHLVLSLGLAAFGIAYSFFISIIYALFNFPIFISSMSLSGYSIYSLNAALLLPLIVQAIYWYVVACFIRVPITAKDKTLKFKYGFYIVSAFLFFAILTVIWFSISLGTVFLFY